MAQAAGELGRPRSIYSLYNTLEYTRPTNLPLYLSSTADSEKRRPLSDSVYALGLFGKTLTVATRLKS